MSIRTIASVLFALSALVAVDAQAAVKESTPDHLTLTYAFSVKVDPPKAYAAVADVAHWWNSDHTYSGSSANLHLDAKAGGCWCETWKGGSVQHMTVLAALPGQLLRLRGGLGPLQGGALSATLTFQFKPVANGSEISVSYVVAGFIDGGLDKVAPGVDGVLGSQLQRLGRLIDTGSADEGAKKS
jgi:uncharacterized protein YndB with AHSA1/START domain